MTADCINDTVPTLFANGFAWRGEFGPVDDQIGAQRLEKFVFMEAPC